MPSGPKKRKAERKKKEKKYDNDSDPSSPSAHSHEVDDGKHKDDRESDVGELSSPASQDHNSHQNLLTDGEEEEIEKEESCSTVPPVEALKIDDKEEQNIVLEDENGGEVKREFEIPSELDEKDENIVYNEPSKKSEDGGSSDSSGGGGSSSSCDESNGVKNSRNVDVSPVHDSVEAAAVPETSSKNLHIDTIGEVGNSSYPIKKSADSCSVESVLDENKDEKISSLEHKVYSAASEREAEEATIQPIEDTTIIPEPKAFETQESGHRTTQSYNPPGAEDSAVSETLLAPTSHPEKTSWKSCCGLFEVFVR